MSQCLKLTPGESSEPIDAWGRMPTGHGASGGRVPSVSPVYFRDLTEPGERVSCPFSDGRTIEELRFNHDSIRFIYLHFITVDFDRFSRIALLILYDRWCIIVYNVLIPQFRTAQFFSRLGFCSFLWDCWALDIGLVALAGVSEVPPQLMWRRVWCHLQAATRDETCPYISIHFPHSWYWDCIKYNSRDKENHRHQGDFAEKSQDPSVHLVQRRYRSTTSRRKCSQEIWGSNPAEDWDLKGRWNPFGQLLHKLDQVGFNYLKKKHWHFLFECLYSGSFRPSCGADVMCSFSPVCCQKKGLHLAQQLARAFFLWDGNGERGRYL